MRRAFAFCACGTHKPSFVRGPLCQARPRPPHMPRVPRRLFPTDSCPGPGALPPLCSKLLSGGLLSLSGAFSASLIAALLISGVFSAESCLALVGLTVLLLEASAQLGEVKLVL